MSLLVDAVVSARHMSRYQSLRIAQQHAGGDYWEGLQRALLRCGIPALAPAIAMIGLAFSTRELHIAVTVALGVTLSMVYVGARSRMSAFDLLRHPSRGGLVLGATLHAVPWLAWCGACSALAIALSAPGAQMNTAGVVVLVAAFLLPSVAALRGASRRVLERSGASQVGRLLPVLVFLVASSAAERWLPDYSSGVVGAIAAGLSMGVIGSAVFASVREVSFVVVVFVGLAFPVSEAASRALVAGDTRAMTVASVVLLLTVALIVSELFVQVRHVDRMEVVRSRADDGDAPPSSYGPVVFRRERAGSGIAAARRRYYADLHLPDPTKKLIWWKRASAWTGLAIMLPLIFLRGPALAVLAVTLSGSEAGGVVVVVAMLSAFWASRATSVEVFSFEERLWLLGVDYRDQALHGLRCLLFVGLLPTLLAAVVTLLVLSPLEAARQAAVLLIVSAFLLRAGLVGLWPFREEHRLRPAFLLTTLAIATLAPGPVWSGDELAYAIYTCAGLGTIGLALRLRRLRKSNPRAPLRVA